MVCIGLILENNSNIQPSWSINPIHPSWKWEFQICSYLLLSKSGNPASGGCATFFCSYNYKNKLKRLTDKKNINKKIMAFMVQSKSVFFLNCSFFTLYYSEQSFNQLLWKFPLKRYQVTHQFLKSRIERLFHL